MTENDGSFRYALFGASACGSPRVIGSDTPSPQAGGSSVRKPVKDLAQVDWSRVRLAAYQIARNVAASHDIAQTICTRFLEFTPERKASIVCWQAVAVQAARYEAHNWRREHSRYVSTDQLTQMMADVQCDPAVAICNQDEAARILATLPDRLRTPFILCKIYDYTAEEVAAELNISVDAVWKRVQRAFETLEKAGFGSQLRQPRIRSLFSRKEQ
jgi:RNA polymerase sigma factor (sigma-70 family)